MKHYYGNVPVLKLGSTFYWQGKKYKITNTNTNQEYLDKGRLTIGVKLVDENASNP